MRKRLLAVLVACCVFCLVFVCTGCGKKDTPSPAPASPAVTKSASNEPFYALVVGNDTRTGTIGISEPQYADGNARSDTMMLLRVDPTTYQIAIITVPRDTSTTIDGQTVKLNEGYARGGMQGAVKQVEDLTGVDIKYYFNMTFVQFEDFIDRMGGVEVNVPVDMSLQDIVHGDQITLTEGDDQVLDGEEALVFARQRKGYAGNQDAVRQVQDRQVVQSLIEKVLAQPSDTAGTYATIMTTGSETNITSDELSSYMKPFMDNADKVTFVLGTGPYDGALDEASQLWLIPRDETTWRELIKVVESGGDPSTVVEIPAVSLS